MVRCGPYNAKKSDEQSNQLAKFNTTLTNNKVSFFSFLNSPNEYNRSPQV